jgi:CRISPR type III-A-associated protein Csm2
MYNNQQNRNTQPDRGKVQYGHFFKEDGSLMLDWVGNKAKLVSEDFSDKQLSSTGLRNFYNEFLRIKQLPNKHIEEKLILIKLLVAKVHYKEINSKVPHDFTEFITKLVNEIGEDMKKFENSCLIMEAIVGFFPKK